MSNTRATIITIGDELLIGQVIDTNSAWMAQRLNELGIEVQRRVAVADDAMAITNALDEEIPRAEIILLTGGLGPTADDITKPLLREYFGGNMIVNEAVLEHVKDIFSKRNRPFLDRNMKQAEVPDTCTVLFNKKGTAPGMLFEKDGKLIIAMPGVPFEMMGIMEDEVLPLVQKRFASDAILHRCIITAGEGESFIAEKIADLENALPSYIKLAYLPVPGMVRLRLSGTGADKQQLSNELQLRQEEIANRIEDIVISLEDLPMEVILGKLLTEKNATLGLAESCTGGYIAHHMTQVMGSAGYFAGSIVCYQEHVKEDVLGVKQQTLEKHGAVSEETAIEMVEGARRVLKSDYTLSITGVISPGGESDKVPVGTVWIAVADKKNIKARKFRFHYDRIQNKEVCVRTAMLLLWKLIQGKL